MNPSQPFTSFWILFQILKGDSVKVLHSICQQVLENSALVTGLEKVSFLSSPKEGQCQRMLKLPHNCIHFTTSKVMLKILQARLQQHMNQELPDVQAGFRKGKGISDQLQTSTRSSKKQESSTKISTHALLTMPKHLTVWITTNCGKFLKRWKYQTT